MSRFPFTIHGARARRLRSRAGQRTQKIATGLITGSLVLYAAVFVLSVVL